MSPALGPVVFATFVIRAAIRWVSGGLERVVEEAPAREPRESNLADGEGTS